ncbi:MAG TPA: phosphatase PAP2 family protein [Terriglobia bacterium]|nr:phosphatase PAP2 family protein [Terriglobia bacterium]
MERALTAAGRMRVSEKLVLVYLTYTAAAATFFRMSVTQGLTIAALNVATSAVIALLSRFSAERQVRRAQVWPAGTGRRWALTFTPNGGRSEFLAVVRDWFPAVVILLAYREAGVFVTPDPAHHLDFLFVAWDHALLGNAWVAGALQLLSPWIERYLEFCYAFCYPIVPLGLGALYALGEWPGLDRDAARGAKAGSPGEGRAVDYFWTTVLMALFTCYVLFPLFPSMPPRLLFHDSPAPAVQPVFRHVNFWILGRYGIDSSVFPSGHVAAVTSTALAVRAVWPRAGTAFAIAAVSVAAATVVGRYHYAADSLTGALIGVAAYLASSRIHTR